MTSLTFTFSFKYLSIFSILFQSHHLLASHPSHFWIHSYWVFDSGFGSQCPASMASNTWVDTGCCQCSVAQGWISHLPMKSGGRQLARLQISANLWGFILSFVSIGACSLCSWAILLLLIMHNLASPLHTWVTSWMSPSPGNHSAYSNPAILCPPCEMSSMPTWLCVQWCLKGAPTLLSALLCVAPSPWHTAPAALITASWPSLLSW